VISAGFGNAWHMIADRRRSHSQETTEFIANERRVQPTQGGD
jgi:hypothetical protein